MSRRLAVIGGGWAGLAAAVRGVQSGHTVTIFETARVWGGRARTDPGGSGALDNGQHILIGAYSSTLDLLKDIGVDRGEVFHRMPLTLCYPDGRGLKLRAGPPLLAFARAVFGAKGWKWSDRTALLGSAARWARHGFECPQGWTVERLCKDITLAVRRDLIEPLCVAALNTPATLASAQVFLTVMRDALFSGPGSADLLLPRVPLGDVLPAPALRWLVGHGSTVRAGHRVGRLEALPGGWGVDGEPFDAVVLACSAAEAGRLAEDINVGWASVARSLTYEPIITVYLRAIGVRLHAPLVALLEGPDDPAQFAFDHGAFGGTPGRLAFVISGASRWVELGNERTGQAVLRQALRVCATPDANSLQIEAIRSERRATFRCVPTLHRPPQWIAQSLVAAGDYTSGPYPATLEAAVRSGNAAVGLLGPP